MSPFSITTCTAIATSPSGAAIDLDAGRRAVAAKQPRHAVRHPLRHHADHAVALEHGQPDDLGDDVVPDRDPARGAVVDGSHLSLGEGWSILRSMSRVCSVCNRKPSFGHNRSHSMIATKRRFDPNLQRVRILVDGVQKRAYVCTRCLKGGKVQKAL